MVSGVPRKHKAISKGVLWSPKGPEGKMPVFEENGFSREVLLDSKEVGPAALPPGFG